MVLKTTDPDYNIGSNIDQIPVGWLSIECDFASATQRHIRQVKTATPLMPEAFTLRGKSFTTMTLT